jgi:hypothetical protein
MIKFERHADIALNRAEMGTGAFRAVYANDYEAIFRDVARGVLQERDVLRSLLVNDLWFLVRFGLDAPWANHPFVVNMAQVVQRGPQSDTLDIWARYHWKSTLITIGETLQYHLRHPEECSCILCYNRPVAKKPLRAIKETCEQSDLLKWCFPEILWDKPETQAPKWSEDDGLVFKRKSHARPTSTIEAWGLTEGMPTGSHYERLVFDDLETLDIKDSPDMLNKVYERFMMARGNLGMGRDSDKRRIIGTYYSHFGPNVKIRDLRNTLGEPMYCLRLIPATDDGTKDGKPVYMEPKTFEMEKANPFFNSQQLCDPTPITDLRLDKSYLHPVNKRLIPHNIIKFMIIDQAGGDETQKQSTDMWSFGVIGVEPLIDQAGQPNIYLLDLEADKMSHSEGINGVVTMYLRNGIIEQLGCEKVGLSTTEIHIANALRVRGRRLSLEGGNLVLLKPGGRSKNSRIESNLQWPLNNGKIFYSDDIDDLYISKLKEEMDKFPFYHVDILDMLAYGYDMIKDYDFAVKGRERTQNDDILDFIKRMDKQNNIQSNPLYHGLRVVG